MLSEAINNAFRMMIGWVAVDPGTLPPASAIVAFWFGGAFLMAAKRLSEFRDIGVSHGRALLVRYRRSFAQYNEVGLTVATFVYGLLSLACISVFLIKYRIEYLLCVPFIVALFGQYLAIAMRTSSTAQLPEQLFRERALMASAAMLTAAFTLASLIDLPLLDHFASQSFIRL